VQKLSRLTKETKVATCLVSATPTNVLPLGSVQRVPEAKTQRRDQSERDSENNLVRRAQRGDEQAFATLYQLHKKRVYAVCLQMTKDVADAEDLTQDAFLQVFRSVNSFRGDSAFSTWLYRIAVNTVLMKLRRRKSPPLLSLDEPVSADSPSQLHKAKLKMRDVLFPKKKASRASNGGDATENLANSMAPSRQSELTPLCSTI
jgi:RNA polymerase sigma factor (sigma-70 family)